MLPFARTLSAIGLAVGRLWPAAWLSARARRPAATGAVATTANGEWPAYHGNLRNHHYSPLPAPQCGSPMTYMFNGKQHFVVAVSGGNYAGEYLALQLNE